METSELSLLTRCLSTADQCFVWVSWWPIACTKDRHNHSLYCSRIGRALLQQVHQALTKDTFWVGSAGLLSQHLWQPLLALHLVPLICPFLLQRLVPDWFLRRYASLLDVRLNLTMMLTSVMPYYSSAVWLQQEALAILHGKFMWLRSCVGI